MACEINEKNTRIGYPKSDVGRVEKAIVFVINIFLSVFFFNQWITWVSLSRTINRLKPISLYGIYGTYTILKILVIVKRMT